MEVSRSYQANLAILQEKFQRETWNEVFWSKFAGFASENYDNGQGVNGMPTGNVVTVYTEFDKQGRDHMLVPFLKHLTEMPVYGDTVLAGTGEKQTIDFLRVYINQVRKAVEALSGNMSNQRIKLYNMIEKAMPQLKELLSQAENIHAWQAIYEGASANITGAQTAECPGLQKRYHPNFYYVSAAKTITAVGTEKYTKTAANLDTAEDAVDAGATFIISSDIVDKAIIKARNLRIPQIVTASGYKYYLCVVSPEQMYQLKNDSKIYSANREAFSGKMLDSPELQGFNEKLYYSGAVFVTDDTGIRGWDATNKNFAGSGGWLEPFVYSAGTGNHCMVLLGKNAMAKGMASNWAFTKELYDHFNVKEIGANAIYGYNRMEYATPATESTAFAVAASEGVVSATPLINNSSLILMTNV